MAPTYWDVHNGLIDRVITVFPQASRFVEKNREQKRNPSVERIGAEGDGIFDFALSLIKEHGPEDARLKSLLELLEHEYRSSPPQGEGSGIKTVISIEFIGGIADLSDPLRSSFIEILPPGLKAKSEAFERSKALCLELAAADPWLAEYVHGQIDCYEEILPHVIVGDLFPKLLERMREFGSGDHVVAKVLSVLESTMENDPEDEPILGAKNVIAVSFIEHMPTQGEQGAKLAEMLPPAMKAELSRQESLSRRHRDAESQSG